MIFVVNNKYISYSRDGKLIVFVISCKPNNLIILLTFKVIVFVTTGATSGSGTTYPSRVHVFTTGFLVGFVLLNLKFHVYVLYIVVCHFVLFLLAIVMSVLLRYTDSDYPFGIFKLFLHVIIHINSISAT